MKKGRTTKERKARVLNAAIEVHVIISSAIHCTREGRKAHTY